MYKHIYTFPTSIASSLSLSLTHLFPWGLTDIGTGVTLQASNVIDLSSHKVSMEFPFS